MRRLYFFSSGFNYREVREKLNLNFSRARYVIKYIYKKKGIRWTLNKPRNKGPRKLDTIQRRTTSKEPSKNSFLSTGELAVDVASISGIIITH